MVLAAGAFAAAALTAAPAVAAVPEAAVPPDATAAFDAAAPQYRADQIAQFEAADVPLEARVTHTVEHADAAFIKARFDSVALGEQDRITVASADGAESREYGPADVSGGALRALSIDGDAAEILLHDAEDGVTATARLAGYSRGLNEAELASRPSAGPESVCGRDDSLHAACYRETDPQAWDASRSVARLIINDENYCTGWIAGDNRIMTNQHCIESTEQARTTEVQFGYECYECAGGATSTPIKVRGDEVLASNRTYDFTLFTVDDREAIAHLPRLAIDTRHAEVREKVFIPGHPGGKPLRISSLSDEGRPWTADYCQIRDNRADGIGIRTDLAYFCDTAGGSSGSPVISRKTGAVVGLHHLGGCPNSGVRMDLIHPLIAPYLEWDV